MLNTYKHIREAYISIAYWQEMSETELARNLIIMHVESFLISLAFMDVLLLYILVRIL